MIVDVPSPSRIGRAAGVANKATPPAGSGRPSPSAVRLRVTNVRVAGWSKP